MNKTISHAMVLLLAAQCAGLVGGCAHQRQVTAQLTGAAAPFEGQVMELRHSSIFGEMYDDDEQWLLSSYPFEDIYHRIDLFERPIHPHRPLGQMPAGTAVRVDKIEPPTHLSWLRRMPNSPADHVWVRISPVLTPENSASHPERPLYLVLPNPIQSAEELSHALNQVLAPQGEVSTWLASLRPTQQVAIAHKDVQVGMQKKELVASAGEPWRWLEDRDAQGQPLLVAWYPSREAWLLGDAVIDVRAPRRLH